MSLHTPHSCASCARADCHLSFVSRDIAPVSERTAFVLDEAWPELRDFVAGQVKADDQILAPGVFGRSMARYDWGNVVRADTGIGWATLTRHITMRRVAKARGAVRQAAYLDADLALAQALARRIDYRAAHLVVSQTLLPFLWREGALGGRSFDVLMTRYPLAELHARLDVVHARHGESSTIADFRAPETWVAAEVEALVAARRVISPHHDIAQGFGRRGLWLDWQRPPIHPRRAGNRVAFLGPSIARQGAYEVRERARVAEPLIVFGADLEGAGFWDGIAIERRQMGPDWLDDIGTILHPAAVTHEPRKLVEAVMQGVAVYAHASCGLPPGQFLPWDGVGADYGALTVV